MRVKFWDRPCIGIKPEAFAGFHGDYDGDEAHCYPLSSPDSLWEASNWVVPELEQFARGRRMMKELGLQPDTLKPEDHSHFVEYTILSSRQLAEGEDGLYFGEESRNPKVYVNGMSKRYNDASTEDTFVLESVRGTMDILRQQLSQSSTDEMTRNAKISSSCFYRPEDGNICTQTRQGSVVLARGVGCDPGSPVNRAAMMLCSKAQQSALDAHRVGSKANTGFDFIADIFKPNVSTHDPEELVTFCMFDSRAEKKARDTA
ncbi:hypothetical protein ColKHC_14261 [Colletotrichum higginsianum]|nr:hypothetical protein ColKHC_14261 [Colletotrichum higginsianum]